MHECVHSSLLLFLQALPPSVRIGQPFLTVHLNLKTSLLQYLHNNSHLMIPRCPPNCLRVVNHSRVKGMLLPHVLPKQTKRMLPRHHVHPKHTRRMLSRRHVPLKHTNTLQ